MKEFVDYQIALDLKELGFDEPCFTSYSHEGEFKDPFDYNTEKSNGYLTNSSLKDPKNFNASNNSILLKFYLDNPFTAAPLWQQAFDWFSNKHNLPVCLLPYIATKKDWEDELVYIPKIYTYEGIITLSMGVYEEARLACLEKLIELCKEKKS